jgi:hypothetical protein
MQEDRLGPARKTGHAREIVARDKQSFLQKPFDLTQLSQTIAAVLATHWVTISNFILLQVESQRFEFNRAREATG